MNEPDPTGADLRVPARPRPTIACVDAEGLAEFGAFYREFTPPLMGFLILQGARPADAADIVQETMAKAWRAWSTITSPKAWARRVAGRELVRRVAALDEDLIAEPEQSSLLPTCSDIDEWIQQDDYYRALTALPPRQRQVMAWTMEGYKPAEIAAILRLHPATVRSNLSKARRAIAIHLSGGAQR
ncbi:RNA polymerase sigma factor [Nocardia wallacei]|uniref:RNA polymerase sigma factor n=1 Tax=Nocardia wallacei TaxID=480035 RepID=UPI0024544FDC|nr:sigma-70 family RNA polymerase sigma factor [Nocardia wallacei]